MSKHMYVRVRHTVSGAEDMVPESAAAVMAGQGRVEILDPTPSRWRRIEPGQAEARPVAAKRTKGPKSRKPTAPVEPVTEPVTDPATAVATEPAPLGAAEPEEATENE